MTENKDTTTQDTIAEMKALAEELRISFSEATDLLHVIELRRRNNSKQKEDDFTDQMRQKALKFVEMIESRLPDLLPQMGFECYRDSRVSRAPIRPPRVGEDVLFYPGEVDAKVYEVFTGVDHLPAKIITKGSGTTATLVIFAASGTINMSGISHERDSARSPEQSFWIRRHELSPFAVAGNLDDLED